MHIAERYGQLPLKQSLAPAIRLAREGFPVDEVYQRMARLRQPQLLHSEEAKEIFLIKGEVPELGEIIRQRDLAKTLEALVKYGYAGFYQGKVAERLVKEVQAAGGIWTPEDLAQLSGGGTRHRSKAAIGACGSPVQRHPLPAGWSY